MNGGRPSARAEARICLGAVTGAHGVRGLVKVKPFTQRPEDIAAYGPVSDQGGRRQWKLAVEGVHKDSVLTRFEGVADRDAAQRLKGTRLYVPRSALPAAAEDEFYLADLVGLELSDASGRALGTVQAVHDFGAGPLVEMSPTGGGESLMLPFTVAVFPRIDLAARCATVVLPDGLVEG
ncbi:MAG: 16S rRNA processing protein RimM [Alphaproteobacteria bacterium]|nr:16S rRNA processing protein RimM [Alphaproteobacteria bacterium]